MTVCSIPRKSILHCLVDVSSISASPPFYFLCAPKYLMVLEETAPPHHTPRKPKKGFGLLIHTTTAPRVSNYKGLPSNFFRGCIFSLSSMIICLAYLVLTFQEWCMTPRKDLYARPHEWLSVSLKSTLYERIEG